MKNKIVLFLASFLLIGLFVFHLGKGSPKKEDTVAPRPEPPPTVAETKPDPHALIDVDFANASLDAVAAFVASVSRKGIVFNGRDEVLISWIEQGIRPTWIFDAFQNVLGAYNLTMRPINDKASVFEIVRLRDIPVPVRLDYAWSSKGLFLAFDSVIYPYKKFPYPLHQANGSWFALIPSSQADRTAKPPAAGKPTQPETPPSEIP